MSDLVRIDRGELVRIDASMLPREAAYRPVPRRRSWSWPNLMIVSVFGGVVGWLSSSLMMSIGVAAFVGYAAPTLRVRAFHRDLAKACALLVAREHAAAARMFDRLCARARGTPAHHSVFVFYRAIVHLERGEIERAIALLHAVVHAGWMDGDPLADVLGQLAFAEALRGRVDVARAWRARAHAVISDAKRGALRLADVAIQTRVGEHGGSPAIVEQGEHEAAVLAPPRLDVLCLLHAFTLERAARGSEHRGRARDEALARVLAVARTASPGAYDFLAIAWPDLRQFLDRHGFVRAGR